MYLVIKEFKCFNSKLVRLKAKWQGFLNPRQCLFQFQIGSIKRFDHAVFPVIFFEFQFQIGSIKSEAQVTYTRDLYTFQFQIGSIKSEYAEWVTTQLHAFQFQIGSIKRECCS